MRSHRRPRPRAEWEALVREWRAGDLTQREFARRKGLAPTTLSWWSCAALNTVEAQKSARRSPEFKLLIAEKNAKTLVPFLFFAAYTEAVPRQPERDWASLKPALEKYFDQKIVR